LLYADLFGVKNVAYMHVPFDNVRYSLNASSNINYFRLILKNVNRGVYEIKTI